MVTAVAQREDPAITLRNHVEYASKLPIQGTGERSNGPLAPTGCELVNSLPFPGCACKAPTAASEKPWSTNQKKPGAAAARCCQVTPGQGCCHYDGWRKK